MDCRFQDTIHWYIIMINIISISNWIILTCFISAVVNGESMLVQEIVWCLQARNVDQHHWSIISRGYNTLTQYASCYEALIYATELNWYLFIIDKMYLSYLVLLISLYHWNTYWSQCIYSNARLIALHCISNDTIFTLLWIYQQRRKPEGYG